MKTSALILSVCVSLASTACGLKHVERAHEAAPNPQGFEIPADQEAEGTIRLDYDFARGEAHAWHADSAFYNDWMVPEIGFTSGVTASPVNVNETAFELKGANVSVSLFMYLTREIGERERLRPLTEYEVEFKVYLLSAAARTCVGFGGSPGEMMVLAGVTPIAPKKTLQGDFWKLNPSPVDDPEFYTNAGDIDNGKPCEPSLSTFAKVERTVTQKILAETDHDSRLHLIVGTAGGFMGETRLFIQRIEVRLEPQAGVSGSP